MVSSKVQTRELDWFAPSFPSARVRHAPELSLKCQAKLGLRHSGAHRFIQIFHGLDEMGLADKMLASAANSMATVLISSITPPPLTYSRLTYL